MLKMLGEESAKNVKLIEESKRKKMINNTLIGIEDAMPKMNNVVQGNTNTSLQGQNGGIGIISGNGVVNIDNGTDSYKVINKARKAQIASNVVSFSKHHYTSLYIHHHYTYHYTHRQVFQPSKVN